MRKAIIIILIFLIGINIAYAYEATGGTITYAGEYTIHKFTSSGTFTPSSMMDVEYLVIAGGGGGGSSGANYCGGGGAGGLLQGNTNVTVQSYTITVGSGGGANANGQNSVFSDQTAIGGGRGANGYAAVGGAGGSGGGGGPVNAIGGSGTAGQGNRGGYASSANQGGTDSAAGGGGGAGGIGQSISAPIFSNSPKAGGVGLQLNISGTPTWYAAGGTGSGWYANAGTNGIGGSVYGGHAAGTANTGSGGGGGRVYSVPTGGSGGSGIVIIRYLTNAQPIYTHFEPTSDTTNFSEVSDVTNVTNLTLGISGKGKIQFGLSHSINAEGEDYDANVIIDSSVIFVNSSALHSTFNDSATLTFYSVDCNKPYVYYSEDKSTFAGIIAENERCFAPLCTNIQCSSGTLTVDVAHFTGYAAGTNANLTIWSDAGIFYENETVSFYAFYINSTDGDSISGECNISFDDNWGTWFEMDYNGSQYNYSRSFLAGTHEYNVTCYNLSYNVLEATDAKYIFAAGTPIPEFSTMTLVIGLIAVLVGLVFIRKR